MYMYVVHPNVDSNSLVDLDKCRTLIILGEMLSRTELYFKWSVFSKSINS